jgi:hypothetical protein
MQHLYDVQSSAYTNTSATIIGQHISNQRTSSQHIFSRTPLLQLTLCHCQMNYKMPYLKRQLFKLQLQTAKEFVCGSLLKEFIYLEPVEYVSQI